MAAAEPRVSEAQLAFLRKLRAEFFDRKSAAEAITSSQLEPAQ
jgi:hypothetical protein